MATRTTTKHVETLKHDEAKRKNLPSAEQQSFVQQEQTSPKQIRTFELSLSESRSLATP